MIQVGNQESSSECLADYPSREEAEDIISWEDQTAKEMILLVDALSVFMQLYKATEGLAQSLFACYDIMERAMDAFCSIFSSLDITLIFYLDSSTDGTEGDIKLQELLSRRKQRVENLRDLEAYIAGKSFSRPRAVPALPLFTWHVTSYLRRKRKRFCKHLCCFALKLL